MQETRIRSLGWKDLEKRMATHSSILVWRIPWTEEPGGLQFMGLQESDTTKGLTLPLVTSRWLSGLIFPLLPLESSYFQIQSFFDVLLGSIYVFGGTQTYSSLHFVLVYCFFCLFCFLNVLFIYFCQFQAFTAVPGLSLLWQARATLCYCAWPSHCHDFSCWGAQALDP